MGRLLLTMRRRGLYRSLGFVRLGDYVLERLGISYRTAQELIRTEEALQRMPLVAATFEAGQITPSHLRVLSRLPALEAEEFWVALARRLTVRELASAVEAALSSTRDEPFGAAPGGHGTGERGSTTPLRKGGGACDDGAAGASPDDDAGSSPTAVRPARMGRCPGEEGESRLLEIPAPAWMLSMWRESLAMIRQAGGGFLAPGAALECALAEFEVGRLATVDDASDSATHDESRIRGEVRSSPGLDDPVAGRPRATVNSRSSASEMNRNAKAGLPSMPEDGLSAREVDGRLKALLSERQRQQSLLAAHLFRMRETRGYLREGHHTLAAYARDGWDLSPRMLRYLLSLHRKLERCGALRQAFERGRVTLKQALVVASVAEGRTIDAWIERASGVTLRRLEDEVEFWSHLRAVRPEVWALLKGGPLPEGIRLVPGRPAGLMGAACQGTRPERVEDGRRVAPCPGGHGRTAVACACGERGGIRDADEGGLAIPGDMGPSKEGRHVSAQEFLQALHQSESEVPLPDRIGHIRIRIEPEVVRMWREIVLKCRDIEGREMEEWEVLALVLHNLWNEWDNVETRRQRREHPALERDGWRCTAPGCGSIGTGRLHTHHIVFRSAGGEIREASNLTTLCTGHHLGLLHEGRMHCGGTAPDALRWELGVEPGAGAFLRYENDRRMGGTAV